MRKLFHGLIKDERGVTAMEYGLIAGLVACVIVGSVTLAGTSLDGIFGYIAGKLAAAVPAA